MGDYTKKVKEILSDNGYRFERHGKGDHEIWYNPVSKKHVSVDGQIKLKTSANELLKDAGLGKRF